MTSYPQDTQPGTATGWRSVLTAPSPAERGLRGVMSAILVLEAVMLLLALTVLHHGGSTGSGWKLAVVAGLAVTHCLLPALLRRSWSVLAILLVQGLVIACWALHPAIGITGIVFALAWGFTLYMRREFARRLRDLGQPHHAAPDSGTPDSHAE